MAAGTVIYFLAVVRLLVKIHSALAALGVLDRGPLESAIDWRDNVVRPASALLLIAANVLATVRPKR
jgi:hypothetical protein